MTGLELGFWDLTAIAFAQAVFSSFRSYQGNGLPFQHLQTTYNVRQTMQFANLGPSIYAIKNGEYIVHENQ